MDTAGGRSMKERYARNIGTVTSEEQEILRGSAVCVVGCGGLGGGVIEGLTRIGVGRLTIIDGDVFEMSNLNRQLFSNEDNIGHSKAVDTRLQLKKINSDVQVNSIQTVLDEDNALELIHGHDVVVDALDSVRSRITLEEACETEKIPLVHGAIEGWNGQVAVIMPGDRILQGIYGGAPFADEGSKPSNSFFTASVISAIEVAETVKLLLDRDGKLTGRMLTLDLLGNEYEIIEF